MRVGNLPGIRRLPMYLDLLRCMREAGNTTVSAGALAGQAGLVASVVRKDLEMTGAEGVTGIGFSVDELIAGIEAFLGWDNPNEAFLVGAGNLGEALLGNRELRTNGLTFVAAFDIDPQKTGTTIHGVKVLPMSKLPSLPGRLHVTLGVLAVPADQSQYVADRMIAAGITRIWSFTSRVLQVPEGVTVQREDLSAGFAALMVRAAEFPK